MLFKHSSNQKYYMSDKPSLIQEEMSKIHNLESVPHHVHHDSNAAIIFHPKSTQLRELDIYNIRHTLHELYQSFGTTHNMSNLFNNTGHICGRFMLVVSVKGVIATVKYYSNRKLRGLLNGTNK